MILEQVIRNVLSGQILEKDTHYLKGVADDLKAKGAEGIILGCTELPLVFPNRYSLTVYNSLAVLAMALLKRYYKELIRNISSNTIR